MEDEECDRLFMKRAFDRAGMSDALRTVANGLDALHYLEGKGSFADRAQHPLPEVVLLDLNLPMVHGFDVLKWIRAHARFGTLPVVVFSSSKRDEDKEKARELGASDFVEKPTSALSFGGVVEILRTKYLTR